MTHGAGVKRSQNRNRPSDRRMGDGNPNLKPSQRILKIVVKFYLSIAAHPVTVTSPESGDLLSVAKHSQQRKCKYHYSNQPLEETPLCLSYLTVAYSPSGFPPYMLVTGFVPSVTNFEPLDAMRHQQ